MNSDAISYFPGTIPRELGICPKESDQSVAESDGADSQIANSVTGFVRSPDMHDLRQVAGFSDEVLLGELRTGNNEALAVLFRRYARLVRAVAYRILRDGAEADDLVQEVFLFVYRKGSLFDAARGSARSWIVQVAYHRAIDRRRYLASRHFYSHLELSDTALTSGRFYDQSIEGVLGRKKLREIDEALSEDQRQTLHLYFYEGYTLEEIAKEMAQTVGNVRNHYYRGLEKMRQGIFGAKFRTK